MKTLPTPHVEELPILPIRDKEEVTIVARSEFDIQRLYKVRYMHIEHIIGDWVEGTDTQVEDFH